MIRRILAAGIATAAFTAVVVVSSAAPTTAAVVNFEDLAGNFAGDDREEVFSYAAGIVEDEIITFDNGGVPGGDLVLEFHEDLQVSGRYDPVVGNFDGDAYDEIIWFRPGTGTDYLWNFTSLTSVESTPLAVGGSYEPFAGDFTGDGVDDVFWYAPGTGPDYLWEYNADGTFVNVPQTINGTYTPLAGSFGRDATDDVFWYTPGPGTDYLWDFVVGTTSHVSSSPYPVNGRYRPFVLDIYNDGSRGDDIFWYAPGTAPDYLWDFLTGELIVSSPYAVNGDYATTTPGDYFGDDHDDVFWIGTGAFLWDFALTEQGIDRFVYDLSTTAGTQAQPGAATGGIPGTPGGTLPSRG